MKITTENEKLLVDQILINLGVKKEDAELVTEVVLNADLKGFSSHGIGRFPQYIKTIDANNIKLKGEIEIERETESIAVINGHSLFGQIVATKAMKLAIEKAKKTGVGIVGTHNSNHFGVTGFYSDLAAKEDCIGITFANTEPAIAPLNGKKPIIGTNPIAISIPNDDTYIATDMATSASARGKLLEAQRKGQSIPPNTALDKEGNPTTDPTEALDGSILAFGAHKGYALAFMIEILCGPLVGADVGTNVTGTADWRENCTKGDLFIAINPDKFVGIDAFKAGTNEFIKQIRDADNGFVPGDIEVKRVAEKRENGIEIDSKLYEQLKEICDGLDINIEKYMEK
ncbi:MAG: L-sulfolactate dehydrogenase [Methanobrevibacter wolinii]|uniref:L-sulfolactate dehydrogenase n=1 Tax=Methanobrevibacter wolinii TaxID=190977 RepID=UPI0005B2B762|nr:L-sulfolactate dehydrogenase [Methanobrevibacter wolinii]MDD5960485.1 L-sulfolactate dehydrogenase [Methanobrevibacter wolinii]